MNAIAHKIYRECSQDKHLPPALLIEPFDKGQKRKGDIRDYAESQMNTFALQIY